MYLAETLNLVGFLIDRDRLFDHLQESFLLFFFKKLVTFCLSYSGKFFCKIILASCAENQFKCNNSRCIISSYKCDNQIDCLDGSDEVNCTKGKDWFVDFSFLKYPLVTFCLKN